MSDDTRKARYDDVEVPVGNAGEVHQRAEDGGPLLTTQQGVPVADDQNSLRIGRRGPTAMEDFHFREKLFEKAGVSPDGGFVSLESAEDASGFVERCRKLRFWERE